jgi:hypothetical protein
MEIYTSLSFALMHIEGSSQRVREAFYRALDVAVIQRDFAYELQLLSGLFMYYRWNAEGTAESDLLRKWPALRPSAINLRIVPRPL